MGQCSEVLMSFLDEVLLYLYQPAFVSSLEGDAASSDVSGILWYTSGSIYRQNTLIHVEPELQIYDF